VNRTRVLVVGAVIGAVACAGCVRQATVPGSTHRPAASAGTGPRAVPAAASASQTVTAPLREPWPEHVIWPENAAESYADQVLDQATDVLYTLAPATLASGPVPYVLQATNLRTGQVRHGASYQVSGLALASGYLWVYGTTGPARRPVPVLDEVGTRTLGTVRSVTLPEVPSAAGELPGYLQMAGVAAGPAGSVWAGASRALVRVSARTGTVLARAIVPAGLELDDLAASLGGTYLYAAAQRMQPAYGTVVLQYSAGTGRLLARSGAGPLIWSLGGAELTPVPGGIWVSFRTGMNGASVLLSARSLLLRSGPPAVSRARWPGGTLYSWTMESSAAYGGGALWVMTSDGLRACVNPVTGTARAEETVISDPAQAAIVLAADKPPGEVTAVIIGTSSAAVVSISPPRTCWS
jgi:hypothetical protein